jgi:FtsP/CotA-like multicopper oxidase with cupredoxin domain|nr:laccase [uncultured bacterium]
MKLNRRDFVRLAAMSVFAQPVLAALPSVEEARRFRLELRPEQRNWIPQSEMPVDLWGLSDSQLTLRQGEPVEIEVVNQLPEPTTLHWHGLRIENAMDGVSGLTQEPIPPGGTFTYRFTPEDAGTFWAHSHHKTYEQLARGLYLPVVVEEKIASDTDQDILMVIDDWRVNNEGQLDSESLGSLHEWAHGGRLGNFLTINKEVQPSFTVKAGSRVRLRLLNTANARIFAVDLPEVPAWILAKDGQPLANLMQVTETVVMAPAERYDLILDIPRDAEGQLSVTMPTDRAPIEMAYLQVEGLHESERVQSPDPLPANPIEEISPDQIPDHKLVLDMTGGAMGSMTQAVYNGQQMSMQELIQHRQIWAFNGVANRPLDPLLEARSGELVEIEIINNTGWAHGMHLHGHHFKADLARYNPDLWHDTLLMDSGESSRIRFIAGKPGSWLLHCHMIEHQAAGMVSWIKVIG